MPRAIGMIKRSEQKAMAKSERQNGGFGTRASRLGKRMR
jgi:hypothetical protein